MKKLILLFSICSLQFINAQNKLNGFVGVNYSYFTRGIASEIQAEQSFGINIGASYEMPFNEEISFRPALAYSQIGDRTETTASNPPYYLNSIDRPLSYLAVPMDFKFWNKIYLVAGPQVGYLLNDNSSEKIDLGVNLGTGFTVNRMFFEVGLYQGLKPVYPAFQSLSGHKDVYNGYAKFIVGYTIL